MRKLYKSGFTLLELLIVTSIIGTLSGISLGDFNSSRQSANIAAALAFENQAYKRLYTCLTGQWDFENGDGTDTAGYFPSNEADLSTTNFISVEGVNNGSASGYDGTIYQTTGPRASGYFGFDANTPKTLSLWIKSDPFVAGASAINFSGTSPSNHMQTIETTSENSWTINLGVAGNYTIPVRNIDQWNHYLMTYDGTTHTTYVNGKKAGELTTNSDAPGQRPGFGGGIGTTFEGALDNVRAFNCGF